MVPAALCAGLGFAAVDQWLGQRVALRSLFFGWFGTFVAVLALAFGS